MHKPRRREGRGSRRQRVTTGIALALEVGKALSMALQMADALVGAAWASSCGRGRGREATGGDGREG